jgi:hypothetical protein
MGNKRRLILIAKNKFLVFTVSNIFKEKKFTHVHLLVQFVKSAIMIFSLKDIKRVKKEDIYADFKFVEAVFNKGPKKCIGKFVCEF